MSTEELYQIYLQHPVISTDTRNIAPGSLFFALKGEKFDANTFADKAIEAGAAYVVIDNSEYEDGDQYILVDDVLTTGATVEACARALQRAGARHVDVLTLARVVRPAL